jgi:polyisoprenoid-binding protein YceI
MNRQQMRVAIAVLLLTAIEACQAPAQIPVAPQETLPDLREQYRELSRRKKVYVVNPANSAIRIYVYRAGAAAQLGHNHVLSAPKFEGYVSLSSDKAINAQFEIRLALNDLVVDDPEIRAETGGNFSSTRTPSDIEGTRSNMLGKNGFDAVQFPIVRLRSVSVEGDWPMLVAEVEITLHGVKRVQSVSLHVDHDEKQLAASGSFVLRQSDFNMTPFSALGGLMAVQDAVVISYKLNAKTLE